MKRTFLLKILLSLLVVSGLIAIMSILLYLTSQESSQLLNESYDTTNKISALNDLEVFFSKSLVPVNNYLVTGNKENYNKFKDLSLEADSNFNLLLKNLTTLSYKRTIISQKIKYDGCRAAMQQILNNNNPIGNKELAGKLQKVDVDIQIISKNITELKNSIRKANENANSLFVKKQEKIKVYNSVTISISLIVLIVIFVIITRPLNKITSVTKEILKGNLSVTTSMNSNDEFGTIFKCFMSIIDEQKRLIEKIDTSAQNLSAYSEEVSAIISGVAAGAEHVSTSTMEVTEKMNTQMKEMSNISIIVENSNEMIKTILNSTNDASAASQNTFDSAKQGRIDIENVIKQINSINSAIGTSKQVIINLEELSKNISGITEIIEGVSKHTNLLAFNATIEAARAGEGGRGFGVVSSEIKKLSEQTAQATTEINKTIKDIEGEIRTAVSSIDLCIDESKKGITLSNNVEESFGIIFNNISNISTKLDYIDNKLLKFNEGSSQINSSVKNIVNATNETFTTLESTAALVEEQTAQMDDIDNSARNIVGISQELADSITKFKV